MCKIRVTRHVRPEKSCDDRILSKNNPATTVLQPQQAHAQLLDCLGGSGGGGGDSLLGNGGFAADMCFA